MNTMNPTSAHTASGRSSSKPKPRGIYVLLDCGPSRRAILYADPEPMKKDD